VIEILTPSKLRANLYRILDRVVSTGKPVEITRKGQRLKIVPGGGEKLALLKPHPNYLKVPKEDIVHVDWSHEWRP
jgi:prevent-host-death family protein